MKTEHYKRVEQFMKLAGQGTPSEPTEPSEETRVLRAKLMLEEVLEKIRKGLGVSVTIEGETRVGFLSTKVEMDCGFQRMVFTVTGPYNEQETIDGCLDVSVVNTGTLVAIGVPDEQLLALVDENNLAKFGPGGYRREDGKWMKPPRHKPPAIAEWLEVYREHLAHLKRLDARAAELQKQDKERRMKIENELFDGVEGRMPNGHEPGPMGLGTMQEETEFALDQVRAPHGEQAGPDIVEELEATASFLTEHAARIAENLLQAASEIDRLRKRWAVVEIVTGPGYECGVVYDVGRLSVAVRQVGKPWAGGVLDVPKSSLVVEEGHTAFVIQGSDGDPDILPHGVLNWQKIETAPKNQFVLLARRAGYVTQEWDYQVGHFTEGYHDRWDTIGNDAFDTQPEYWCPLPNAPEWKPGTENTGGGK